MDVFRKQGDMLQTAVLSLEHRTLPAVKLVSLCHIGTPEYFGIIKAHAGQTSVNQWLGFEALQEVEQGAELSRSTKKRVETMLVHLKVRNELANAAGLVTQRQQLGDLDGVNVDVAMNVLAELMTRRHYRSVRLFNLVNSWLLKGTQSKSHSKAGKALAQCRLSVYKTLTQQLEVLGDPRQLERVIQEDAARNDIAFSLMQRELFRSRRVNLAMGALHTYALADRLVDLGYELVNEEWVNCLNLAQLQK